METTTINGVEYDIVYQRPKSMLPKEFHYCPGCNHGTIHKLIAEVIDELGIQHRCIGMASVGCSVFAYDYFNFDYISVPHGRALATATGVKRVRPNAVVISYQGDGDLAAIGTAETIHACNRGERISCFFVNNAIYGMTGGQMAPTTLLGMKTTTSPLGRDARRIGWPVKVSEMLAPLPGAAYIERVSMHDAKNILKAKAAIKKCFRAQLEDKGFGMVEFLSNCNVNWRMTPDASIKFIQDEMVKNFPLGVYRDVWADEKAAKEGK
jgi:2-oxoglutarate ferredoxin oxidoreductase subunit beta